MEKAGTNKGMEAWMSQEFSKWLGSMGYFTILINGINSGYKFPLILTFYKLPGTSKWWL